MAKRKKRYAKHVYQLEFEGKIFGRFTGRRFRNLSKRQLIEYILSFILADEIRAEIDKEIVKSLSIVA